MPSLFSAIFSGIRPARIDANANPRKVSVVDQQGLRRAPTGQEQAVQVEITDAVADASAKGLRALPPGQGQGAQGHGDPSSYAAMGRRSRTHRAADHWQREFGAALDDTPPAAPGPAAEPQPEAPSPAAAAAPNDAATEGWMGHGWSTVMAMALRAYARIFDPDPTFSAVL